MTFGRCILTGWLLLSTDMHGGGGRRGRLGNGRVLGYLHRRHGYLGGSVTRSCTCVSVSVYVYIK